MTYTTDEPVRLDHIRAWDICRFQRDKLMLTQAQLGNAVGRLAPPRIDQTLLSKLEAGQRYSPKTLARVQAVLKTLIAARGGWPEVEQAYCPTWRPKRPGAKRR